MASGTVGKFNIGGNDYLIASTAYATCSTAASTAAKVATIQDSAPFTLITGVTIYVKFTYANTEWSTTLNVNGTGDISITNINNWSANSVIPFTYDGTSWVASYASQEHVFFANIDSLLTTATLLDNKTLLDIWNAYLVHYDIYLWFMFDGVEQIAPLTFIDYDNNAISLEFHVIQDYEDSERWEFTIEVQSGNSTDTTMEFRRQEVFYDKSYSTSISSYSTNDQVPTALAVYNALQNAGGSSLYYDQVTLNTSSWSSNQQSVTVSGMTSTAIVWVNPTDTSKTYWTRANVRATAQATDSLTFTCTDQDLASYSALTVNVVWTEPASQSL